MKRLIIGIFLVAVAVMAISCTTTSPSLWGRHTCQAQKTSNHR